MVKADVRKDYYGDLGLTPSAEAEDIKKQFRKLALKFHPDRNPGKEAEYNAKFQAIQAANEILSDPQQRLKYDTDRLRAGYGKFYGPPKTTQPRRPQPFATPTAAKPQTPKPNFSRPSTATNGPSAGAQRYATHARAGQEWHKTQDETQTRADAYRGFSGMRGSKATPNVGGAWRSFDPQSGRSTPGSTPRQQNTPFGNFSNQRPKSAYEYFKDNSSKTQNPSSPHSPKKRSGFAPGTAGGDEPMARNTSAYTSTRSERPSSMFFESAPPPTAKKPTAPTSPFAEFDSSNPAASSAQRPFAPEFERTSSRYAGSGGEKTFFSSSGLGRSATTRTPSGSYRTSNVRTNPPTPEFPAQARRRSASPKSRRNQAYSSSTSSSEGLSDEEIPRPTGLKPKAVPKSRLRPHQKFKDFHRDDDSSSTAGEDLFTHSNPGRRQPTPMAARDSRDPRRWQGQVFVDLTADSDDAKGHNSDSAAPSPFARPPQATNYDSDFSSFNRYGPWFSIPHPSLFYSLYDRGKPAGTTSGPQSTANGRRNSSDLNSLHKKFSAEEWREHMGSFDFLGVNANATAHEQYRKSPNSQTRNATTPQNGWAQSTTSTGATNPNLQSQGNQKPTGFAQPRFSADQWAEKLRDLAWNIPDVEKTRQSGNTPPTRSPRKQAKSGTKVRSGPQSASVATEAEEARETLNEDVHPEPARPGAVDAEAMDIDEELPPLNGSAGSSKNSSYPDLNPHVPPAAASGASKPEVRPESNGASKAGASTPFFDLDPLRKTAPFTSTNSSGIDNLGDVHANLPFESRAKEPTTTKRDIRPRDLKLPNPPKRPTAPTPVLPQPGSQHVVLPREKWNWYVSAMGTYMHEWNNFNRRMLLHFNTRQEAIETGLAPGWISAVGDSSRLHMNGADEDDDDGLGTHANAGASADDESLVPGTASGGFSAYLRGIEEDMQVRKHWEVACEMHRECILGLGRLREWIRNGGKVV
ncbi:Heat shock protein DnaJ N-terminal [Penicillium capsulatum]|uniref:Heat shock protein DnaJ N-terminal n=1 Tax=Penicillium capsulatum TaxID=69766 RepID=A0A9W9HZJ0_9EURO|nr:Heat shock protein DnaJ N-terminal [Penicillium capsulatum]KAJ6117157.1 Heat shock protein DnaJ N-terminal [Penicillium capsulatum]